jgi:protein-disulfide isomerase
VIAALGLVMLTGCGDSSRPATAKPSPRIRQLDQLLGGIPQSNTSLGSESAPVTLQLFVDVECANTREFVQQALWDIVRRWVRPGQLRLEFHSIVDGSEPREAFLPPQLAALAAGRQNKLWYYLALFYGAQEDLGTEMADSCLTPASLPAKVARVVPGLDLARWTRDQQGQLLPDQIAADERLASHAGLSGTPSVRLGPKGTKRWATFELTANQLSRTRPAPLLRAIARLLK